MSGKIITRVRERQVANQIRRLAAPPNLFSELARQWQEQCLYPPKPTLVQRLHRILLRYL